MVSGLEVMRLGDDAGAGAESGGGAAGREAAQQRARAAGSGGSRSVDILCGRLAGTGG